MIEIDNKIISLDIIKVNFSCDVTQCKGVCCLYGESGAPLEKNEVENLEREYHNFKEYMRPLGVQAIEDQGKSVIDSDGDIVTPLIDKKECAYTIIENGIFKCAIEKAFLNKKTYFRKPISCHLYPVRIKSYEKFDAINYQKWSVCNSAVEMGQKLNKPLYKFLKDALIVKYGETFYKQIEETANHIT